MDMDNYYPYNAIAGDRTHDADDLARIIAAVLTTGVIMVNAADLKVLAAGDFNVTVKAGKCVIEGRIGINSGDKTFTLNAPFDGLDRIDRIVARADYAGRKTTLLYVAGTPAEAPEPPALKADPEGFDIPLAKISVASSAATITQDVITDERVKSGFVVPENMEVLFSQLQATFDIWFATARNTLGEDSAGNLLNMINTHGARAYSVAYFRENQTWHGDPSTGWSYTAIAVPGLKDDDFAIVQPDYEGMSGDPDEMQAAYNLIYRIAIEQDQIVLWCKEDHPTVGLLLTILAVQPLAWNQ